MAVTTVANLNGLFKKQFHERLEDFRPDFAILQKEGFISWVPDEKTNGEFYAIPTLLRGNQSVTYNGDGGSSVTLNTSRSAIMKEAQVYGSEMMCKGELLLKVLSQAAAKGPRAFVKASAWLVEDLTRLAHTRVEIAALYGQSGLGTVESVTDLTGGYANIVITEATWAPGMWVLLEGAGIDSFTGTSKNNSSGVLGVETVTISSRTIKVSFTGTLADEIDADDELYFEGANAGSGTFKEMCGLYKQLTTTSGTLFNIDRGAYTLMQGNVFSSVGPITKAKLIEYSMAPVNKGCMSDLTVLVGTATWSDLAAEDMALRMFDSSYSPEKSQSGSRELIYESVNGSLKVLCHPMLKGGHFIMFNPDEVIWCGSSKTTFEVPGVGGNGVNDQPQFFTHVTDTNYVRLVNYTDCAVYALCPARTAVGTGITH
jgi:hypothetical protein